jgi:hypothetical protein
MDMSLFKPFLAGIAKQGITALGVYLGFTGSQEAQFVGAGMVLVGLGCEWWEQRGQQQVVAILAKMKPVASPGATTAEAAKAGLDAAKAAK